jgi:hypothetical protein
MDRNIHNTISVHFIDCLVCKNENKEICYRADDINQLQKKLGPF